MASEKYVVLMADVMHSSQHAGVQKKLHELVVWANREFQQCWETPLEITRGDELALIARNDCNWLETILRINHKIRPLRLRWIMSYGEIREGLIYKSSAEATGPAFIKADEMMHLLKKKKYSFDIFTGEELWDDILRGQINLLLWRLDQLSDLQLMIFRLYQSQRNQIHVAQLLGKTQQQIQRALQAINWQVIDLAEKSAQQLVKLAMEEITKQKMN